MIKYIFIVEILEWSKRVLEKKHWKFIRIS